MFGNGHHRQKVGIYGFIIETHPIILAIIVENF